MKAKSYSTSLFEVSEAAINRIGNGESMDVVYRSFPYIRTWIQETGGI